MREALPAYAEALPDGCCLRVKVVPGAARDRVMGLLGDHLKLRVRPPPEDGRANAAVQALLARWIGCRPDELELVAGHTRERKRWRYRGQAPLPPA
ncbi:MAG: DUF167 domain-containing protein [Planctomycetota bacterium]